MSRLKTTTALGLVVGLGMGFALTAPAFSAEKAESSASGAAHEKTLPSKSNLGAAGAVKTPSVAEEARGGSQAEVDKSSEAKMAEADKPVKAEKAEMNEPAESEQVATIPGGLTADEIIGREVLNKNGEEVGEVESLVIQPEKGDVHAVISVGGFLGMGDRDVAIPLKELEFGESSVILMSQQTKEQLEAMPEYREEDWNRYEIEAGERPKPKVKAD